MSESPTIKKAFTPYKVWGILMVATILYGLALALHQYNWNFADGFTHVFEGLWRIITSPALLTHDYIAMVGIGPAFVNSGLSGLLILGVFAAVKLPGSGPQMGVFGLVMGFAFMGKNPANMLPIIAGALLYSLFSKQEAKTQITMAGFATCLAPIVSQPAHIPQITDAIGVAGGWAVGIALGLIIGFVINAMAVFIRKSHEGLNLYNIGWGAGLLAIAVTTIYTAFGIERFGPGVTRGYALISGGMPYDYYIDAAGNQIITGTLSEIGTYDFMLFAYLVGVAVFFLVIGLASGGNFKNLKETLYLKAGDSKFINNFYAKYGQGPVYLAMFFLAVLIIALTLPLGIHITGPVLGAALSLIGWGGFGKAVANAAAIIAGVLVAATLRFFIWPTNSAWADLNILEYFRTQSGAIFTTAFWGTCLSPMARFFGWRWAIIVGMLHFAITMTIGSWHWGQNLYNNGLAAGFVCVIMIPIIRSLDKKGKYTMDKVYPDPA